jgi:hypothetical protein
MHQGRAADYLILCWWDQENELPTRVFVSSPQGWRPAAASESIEMIDKEIFIRRRERKRQLMRLCLTAFIVGVLGAVAGLELVARRSYLETHSLISRERMIEKGQYQDAMVLWQGMRERYPYSLTSWIDVPRHIGDLQQRLQETTMIDLDAGK